MGDVPRANFNSDAFGFLPTTGATMNEYKNPSSRISSWQTASSPQQFNRASLWKNAYRDLCHDLKNARWLRGLGWFSGVIWCFGLVATSIYIGVATLNITGEACLPDGSFRLRPDQYSFWSSSGYFQITLGGGRLSFTQAKVIDITWDILVGRGGQVVLAFLSYRVFAKYITVCMETAPINYQTFRTIFLQNDSSLPSTYGLIKSFVSRRRLRSVTAMVFMVVTMIFLLLWPTLASAMSGYDANVGAYIPDENQNFVPFNNFTRLLYIVHDGERIKISNDSVVTDYDYASNWHSDPVLPLTTNNCYYTRSSTNPGRGCEMQNTISAYVKEYGLGGTKNISSVFNKSSEGEIDLPAPILNISKFYSDDDTLGGYNDGNQLPMAWFRDNKRYELQYIEENGTCQNIGDYQWGFSFLQLFIALQLLWLWTVGMYVMWLRAHFAMTASRRDESQTSGVHKGIIELAAAMQKELDVQDIDPALLNEKQLDERINKELKGGGIAYFSAYPEADRHSFRRGMRNWFAQNKWWFLAICCATVSAPTLLAMLGFSGNLAALFFGCLSAGVWVGIALAFCLGTTNGSRALIVLCTSTVCTLIIFLVLITLMV